MKPKNRKAIIAGLAATLAVPDALPVDSIPPPPPAALVSFRSYQLPVFLDHSTKVLMLEWSRQIGKSYTLANWCVDRILRQLQSNDSWTVIVLSNSKDNGGEFAMKVGDAARRLGEAISQVESEDESGLEYDDMKFRVEIRIGPKIGRIIVLAANPRTARGFSGDLILDEFAFHENAQAIWEAAEPIISANPEFLCRIASTHNGKSSMFNQMLNQENDDGGWTYKRSSIRRSDAWATGELKITSLRTNTAITPDQAEKESMDKRAYRQNYENEPGDESGALIPRDLIVAAQRDPYYEIDEQGWSQSTLSRLHRMLSGPGEFSIGQDVARTTDLSDIEILYREGSMRKQVATLEMLGLPLSEQRRQMMAVIDIIRPKLRRVCIDSTGLGTGLVDELTDLYGSLIMGCNFSSTVPITDAVLATGRKAVTMTLPEKMALGLLALFEDRHIEICRRPELMADLRKPGKVVSPDGKRVSIAAARGKDGHADRFWGLALAEHAFQEDGWGSFTADQAEAVSVGGGGFMGTPHISFGGDEWMN